MSGLVRGYTCLADCHGWKISDFPLNDNDDDDGQRGADHSALLSTMKTMKTMMMMMMEGYLANSTDASILCEEELCESLNKGYGVEKRRKGEGKGKCWEETRERTKGQKNESQERNKTACRAPPRRDAATPLTKTR